MEQNPFAPEFDKLPEKIPVFPLYGVLLLPGGQLPLNIFENRYLSMVNDALAGSRIIGMVQPTRKPEADDTSPPPLCRTGCAGKITEFHETPDGRYIISLTGISRFEIETELGTTTAYRQVKPVWAPFKSDIEEKQKCLGLDRNTMMDLLKNYFSKEELECDWARIEETSDNKLITCLSMICPFDAQEKQALLEAPCCKTRGQMFMTMLEMAVKMAESDSRMQH